LGATICTAAAPLCWRCPVRAHCRAYAARQQADENVFSAAAAVADPTPTPARRAAERREAPYGGSNRFFRGRAVDALRTLPAGEAIPLHNLGPRVKEGYAAGDEPWLRALVEGLARDGLAHLEADGSVRLP
jgi:A/G-specific adenine glycosylase